MVKVNETADLGRYNSASAALQSRRAAVFQALSQFTDPASHAPDPPPFNFHWEDGISVSAGGTIASVFEFRDALEAITAKAAEFGIPAASVEALVEGVSGGYVARFPDFDVYFSPATGAHEVHGEIRAKYNALGGSAGALGLPTADEQPASVGRFNHFAGGSIYWTPHTGPMSVRGRIRDLWGSMGFERSDLGFPVIDQYRMKIASPNDPVIEWCQFENGMIASDSRETRVAPFASIGVDNLRQIVWKMIDQQFHESPDNVGMHPDVDYQGVTNWTYGFWVSTPRAAGFRLHGFRDNGWATDTDFFINLWLRLELAWGTFNFAEPTHKSVVASLDWLRVTADGFDVTLGKVITDVTKGIHKAFFPAEPSTAHPEVLAGSVYVADLPTGAEPNRGNINLIGVDIAPSGDFRIFVNPLRPSDAPPTTDFGVLRQILVQTQIDGVVAGLIA